MEQTHLELQEQYLKATLKGNRKDALSTSMDALQSGVSIPALYVDVFQESLYRIGKLWETNQISVADEHRATAITQFVMSNLYSEMDVQSTSSGTAVLTGIQGELHQVGITMVADIMEASGWDVIFLGANTPMESVLSSIHKHHATVLGISVTMFYHIPQVEKLVTAVRNTTGDHSMRILLGGCGIRNLSPLPEALNSCIIGRDLYELGNLTEIVL